MVLYQGQRLAKPLEMNNLSCPKELDHLIYVRIIRYPQNVVIGRPCFLLSRHIFRKIGNSVTFWLEICGGKRNPRCICGIYGVGVINIIISFAVFIKRFCTFAAGQLTDYRTNDLKVSKFFCTWLLEISLLLYFQGNVEIEMVSFPWIRDACDDSAQ